MLTLRQVITQKAAMELLGVKHSSFMRARYPVAYRKGRVVFYTLKSLGIDKSYIPDGTPDVRLDDLLTLTEKGEELGLSREAVRVRSDYQGGYIDTVVPWGLDRFWIANGETQIYYQCEGLTWKGVRCTRMLRRPGQCRFHVSPTILSTK